MESFEDTLPDLYKVGTTDYIFEELDIVKGYHTIPEIPKDSDSLSLPSPISTFSPISSEEELFNLDKLLDSYPSSPESTTTAFSSDSYKQDILSPNQTQTVEDTTPPLSPPTEKPPQTASPGPGPSCQPPVKQPSVVRPDTPIPLLSIPEICAPVFPLVNNSCSPVPLLSLNVTPTPALVNRLTKRKQAQRKIKIWSRKVLDWIPVPKVEPRNIQSFQTPEQPNPKN